MERRRNTVASIPSSYERPQRRWNRTQVILSEGMESVREEELALVQPSTTEISKRSRRTSIFSEDREARSHSKVSDRDISPRQGQPASQGKRQSSTQDIRQNRRVSLPLEPAGKLIGEESERCRSRDGRESRRRSSSRKSRPLPSPVEDIKDGKNDKGGRLWYSTKHRHEGNFFEKHLDSSYDGLLAGAAGAAIGAMAGRSLHSYHTIYAAGRRESMTREESKRSAQKGRAKTLAAAAVSAVAFNVVENRCRVWAEESLDELKWDAAEGLEFVGEIICAL